MVLDDIRQNFRTLLVAGAAMLAVYAIAVPVLRNDREEGEKRKLTRTGRLVASATLLYQSDYDMPSGDWVNTPRKVGTPDPDVRYRPAQPMLGGAQLAYASAPLDFRVAFRPAALKTPNPTGPIDCYYNCSSTGDYNAATGNCTYYNCDKVSPSSIWCNSSSNVETPATGPVGGRCPVPSTTFHWQEWITAEEDPEVPPVGDGESSSRI